MERLREKPQSATAALCEGPQLGPGGPAGLHLVRCVLCWGVKMMALAGATVAGRHCMKCDLTLFFVICIPEMLLLFLPSARCTFSTLCIGQTVPTGAEQAGDKCGCALLLTAIQSITLGLYWDGQGKQVQEHAEVKVVSKKVVFSPWER